MASVSHDKQIETMLRCKEGFYWSSSVCLTAQTFGSLFRVIWFDAIPMSTRTAIALICAVVVVQWHTMNIRVVIKLGASTAVLQTTSAGMKNVQHERRPKVLEKLTSRTDLVRP